MEHGRTHPQVFSIETCKLLYERIPYICKLEMFLLKTWQNELIFLSGTTDLVLSPTQCMILIGEIRLK